MSLLTKNEREALFAAHYDAHKCVDTLLVAFESAILAKLASAELPEPDCVLSTNRYGSSPDAYPVFTADQLHQAFAQGFAAGAAAQLAEKPVGCVVVHGKHKVGMLPAQRDIEAGETLYTRREAK